jgi:dTDP-4-dehydrorhamnose 3,5-epimerase
MGKLIRTIEGRMIDLFLDIRLGSPTFGKIGAFDMYADYQKEYNHLIWVPIGFAHGSVFTSDTFIEYFCTSEYSPKTEAGISPLSSDIDWSMIDPKLKIDIDSVLKNNSIISGKDKDGYTLGDWKNNPNSKNFTF